MKFFKSVSNIIFMSIILVLSVALVSSVAVMREKENELETARSRESEYQSRLSEKENENSGISSELEEIENQKKKLEDENARLKEEKEALSKEAEKQKAAASSAQAELKKKAEAQSAASSVRPAEPVKNKVCYLTFDDGPSKNTLKILEILKKYGAKATFFVVDTKDIGYVRNIYEAGHTVGLHSATHNYSKIYSSTDAFFSDLKKISDRVEGIIGIKPKVIRFPGGSSNLVSKSYCNGIMSRLSSLVGEKGYSYFDWNVESGDADKTTASYTYIRNNVLSGAKNKNSACVLMHDSAAKTTTVQALPEILEGLAKMGYRFEAITPETNGYHHKINN